MLLESPLESRTPACLVELPKDLSWETLRMELRFVSQLLAGWLTSWRPGRSIWGGPPTWSWTRLTECWTWASSLRSGRSLNRFVLTDKLWCGQPLGPRRFRPWPESSCTRLTSTSTLDPSTCLPTTTFSRSVFSFFCWINIVMNTIWWHEPRLVLVLKWSLRTEVLKSVKCRIVFLFLLFRLLMFARNGRKSPN